MFESIGTALGMLIIYFFNEWRKERKRKKLVSSKLKNAINDSNKIYPILWKCLHKYKSNRVFITQFHNGGSYYSTKHIQRMSISHEVTDDNTPAIIDMFTDIIISEPIHQIMNELRVDSVHIEDDIKDTLDSTLKVSMEIYKIKSLYIFPLRSKGREPIGLLSFNFDTPNGLTNFQIAEVEYIKNEIENILNN